MQSHPQSPGQKKPPEGGWLYCELKDFLKAQDIDLLLAQVKSR
jgi:hypothetical protein